MQPQQQGKEHLQQQQPPPSEEAAIGRYATKPDYEKEPASYIAHPPPSQESKTTEPQPQSRQESLSTGQQKPQQEHYGGMVGAAAATGLGAEMAAQQKGRSKSEPSLEHQLPSQDRADRGMRSATTGTGSSESGGLFPILKSTQNPNNLLIVRLESYKLAVNNLIQYFTDIVVAEGNITKHWTRSASHLDSNALFNSREWYSGRGGLADKSENGLASLLTTLESSTKHIADNNVNMERLYVIIFSSICIYFQPFFPHFIILFSLILFLDTYHLFFPISFYFYLFS